jgi:hypothetical protein
MPAVLHAVAELPQFLRDVRAEIAGFRALMTEIARYWEGELNEEAS